MRNKTCNEFYTTIDYYIISWIIVTLILECVMSSHINPSMYQNFKIVSDCALCYSK